MKILLFLVSLPLYAQFATGVWSDTAISPQGVGFRATITVYNANTTTRSSLCNDQGCVQPKSNPFQSDVNGRFTFYVVAGWYDITVQGVGTSLYSYRILVSNVVPSAGGSPGQIQINQSGTFAGGNLSGDITTAGGTVTTLASVVTAGACGGAVSSCSVTYDAKGRITTATSVPITVGGGCVGCIQYKNSNSTLGGGNLSGDVSTSGSLSTMLATVNSSPGLCGDATHICQITTDAKGRVLSQAVFAVVPSAPGVTGNLLYNNLGAIAGGNLSGDVTTSALVATLSTVNGSPGSCGDASHVCQITTDAKGRVLTQTPIAWGNLTGDVTSVGLATTLASVNSAGTCGDTTHVCKVTSDVKGRITAYTNVTIPIIRNATNFNFTRFNGVDATGDLSVAGAHTVLLSPCPAGIVTAGNNHTYFRLSSGVGTAENIQQTSFSSSAPNCTIGFTTSNTHTGAWIISSNAGGTQEASWDASTANSTVYVPAGTYTVYAPIYVPGNVGIEGDGAFSTFFQAQSNNMIVFDSPGNRNHYYDFGITILGMVQGISGSIGIRLGNGADSSFPDIQRIYCEPLYDCILSINAQNGWVKDSIFYNFSHAAITMADPACPDCDGLKLSGNTYFNYLLGSPAEAAVLVHSTSSFVQDHDIVIGTDQVNYCLENDATTSGGWMQITGNKCESPKLGGYLITGTFPTITITGNNLANGFAEANWKGIHLNGTTGSGMTRGTITGNVIQGGGTSTEEGIHLEGTYSRWSITGNSMMDTNYGINANGSPSDVTIGTNSIVNLLTCPVFVAAGGVVVDAPAVVDFSCMTNTSFGIGNAGNGSRVYCTNCNSTCTAGSSTGRTCFRENGAWTH